MDIEFCVYIILSMKIVLIAPGFNTFPPKGWGAVESIVWDYYENLEKIPSVEVHIVNTPNLAETINLANAHQADVVHIMYDDHIAVAPFLQCGKIVYTSHYAYLTHPEFGVKRGWYFDNIFQQAIYFQDIITLHVISEAIANVYIKFGFRGKIKILGNGAREDRFWFSEEPAKKDRSIYVAKIERRKAQYKYQGIPQLDFVGNYHDSPFNIASANYLGEWDKPKLYENLTDYANLVLLSDGEADPLVVKEALVAGLGLVISECATANLDLSMPFITVIPNHMRDNVFYVNDAICRNRRTSIELRDEIREYALTRFSWKSIIKRYLELLKE